MSFAANEELYNVLESRMDLIKEEMISRATNTDDIELKRALTRCLYHHGWVEANLRHCRPAAEMSAAAQAAELSTMLQEINQHEEEYRAI